MKTAGVLLLSILCGCVSVQPYPDTWGPLKVVSGSACPVLSGSYTNRGEGRYAQYPPSLAYQLLEHGAHWREADQVDIELADYETLIIRTRASGRLLDDVALDSGAFSCEDGFLVLKKSEFVNREGALGSRNSTIRITVAGEALIVREDASEVGMLFLIPGGSSYTNWARYARK